MLDLDVIDAGALHDPLEYRDVVGRVHSAKQTSAGGDVIPADQLAAILDQRS